jgi:hypothetical protein
MLPFQDQTPSSLSPLVENDPAAETREGGTQALSEEIQARLKEIFAWLQKDARDQIRDVDYFEGMLEPISQKLPEDIKTSLEPISGLDIHYVAIRRALKSVSTRPAVEQKKAKAEQAAKGAQTQTENHKGMLANLQASFPNHQRSPKNHGGQQQQASRRRRSGREPRRCASDAMIAIFSS